jgi:hypothetical protein
LPVHSWENGDGNQDDEQNKFADMSRGAEHFSSR